MTPVSVPFKSMHLVPSNSTLKPWCADAATPRRDHAATTTPAYLIFISFFLPVGLYTRPPRVLSRLRRRRFRLRRRRFRKLPRLDAYVRLYLSQLDRRSPIGPGDDAFERHLHARDVA